MTTTPATPKQPSLPNLAEGFNNHQFPALTAGWALFLKAWLVGHGWSILCTSEGGTDSDTIDRYSSFREDVSISQFGLFRVILYNLPDTSLRFRYPFVFESLFTLVPSSKKKLKNPVTSGTVTTLLGLGLLSWGPRHEAMSTME